MPLACGVERDMGMERAGYVLDSCHIRQGEHCDSELVGFTLQIIFQIHLISQCPMGPHAYGTASLIPNVVIKALRACHSRPDNPLDKEPRTTVHQAPLLHSA